MNCKFEVYGIRAEHPPGYRIYINQNQKFRFEEGCVKFDDPSEAEESRASMTISWEPVQACDHFAQHYLHGAEEHYRKKVKNRYRILEKKLIDHSGHSTAFIHARLVSATHIFKAIGKSIVLEVMQTACYCPQTKRCVYTTIVAQSDYFQKHLQELEEILLSVSCHADAMEGLETEPTAMKCKPYATA